MTLGKAVLHPYGIRTPDLFGPDAVLAQILRNRSMVGWTYPGTGVVDQFGNMGSGRRYVALDGV